MNDQLFHLMNTSLKGRTTERRSELFSDALFITYRLLITAIIAIIVLFHIKSLFWLLSTNSMTTQLNGHSNWTQISWNLSSHSLQLIHEVSKCCNKVTKTHVFSTNTTALQLHQYSCDVFYTCYCFVYIVKFCIKLQLTCTSTLFIQLCSYYTVYYILL